MACASRRLVTELFKTRVTRQGLRLVTKLAQARPPLSRLAARSTHCRCCHLNRLLTVAAAGHLEQRPNSADQDTDTQCCYQASGARADSAGSPTSQPAAGASNTAEEAGGSQLRVDSCAKRSSNSGCGHSGCSTRANWWNIAS